MGSGVHVAQWQEVNRPRRHQIRLGTLARERHLEMTLPNENRER